MDKKVTGVFSMKIKASDVLLSVLALVAVILANNDVSIVRSRGRGESYPYPYPFVVSILRSYPNPTDLSGVRFDITFSDFVNGVDKSDFTLTTTGDVSDVYIEDVFADRFWSPSKHFTATVNTGTGNGTLRLDVVDDDSVKEEWGNPLGGVGIGNGDYADGEVYTIKKLIPPTNDDISSATQVFLLPYADAIVTSGATLAFEDPSIVSCNIVKGQATVWYEYTPDTNTAITIDTSGTDYDTFIAVWTKNQTGQLEPVACNNNGFGQALLALQVESGVTYYIEIGQP